MITNDAVITGMLAIILGAVFYTAHSQHVFWKRFYRFVPVILLCYFLPSMLTTFGIIDAENSRVYFVASRYLLPTALVLLCLNINIPAIVNLGPKALILFFTGTAGIVIGGPIALLLMSWISPDAVGGQGPEAVWRGMTTVAGSWIGGSANQTAMKEIFGVGDTLFSAMVAVDVIVANVWMAVLLYMAGNAKDIDRKIGADSSAIDTLRVKVETLEKKMARLTTQPDLIIIVALGLGVTGISHFAADFTAPWVGNNISWAAKFSFDSQFFWLIIFATTGGLLLSFTKAREYEGAGASKVGSVCIFLLVAAIGTHMDLTAIFRYPQLFVLGAIWMAVHASLMLIMCRILKAPLFYMAVGSQANVGGAASAPVVAAAFHPALAPVGVLLAVLGYAVGTYAAWLCGIILQVIANS
jgi:uncharacterized membrane protein